MNTDHSLYGRINPIFFSQRAWEKFNWDKRQELFNLWFEYFKPVQSSDGTYIRRGDEAKEISISKSTDFVWSVVPVDFGLVLVAGVDTEHEVFGVIKVREPVSKLKFDALTSKMFGSAASRELVVLLRPCPNCEGSGLALDAKPCRRCSGSRFETFTTPTGYPLAAVGIDGLRVVRWAS